MLNETVINQMIGIFIQKLCSSIEKMFKNQISGVNIKIKLYLI